MNDPITIRPSRPADEPALVALAALDSSRLAAGPLLVAEEDGELRAAIAVESGRPIADPFKRTVELIALLELRAEQLRRRRADGARGATRRSERPLPLGRVAASRP